MNSRSEERRKGIAKWAADAGRRKPVARVELHQVSEDAARDDVIIMTLDAPFEGPTQLSHELHRAAEEDARVEGRTRLYRAISFDEDGLEILRKEWAVDASGGHHYGEGAMDRSVESTALVTMQRLVETSNKHATVSIDRESRSMDRILGHYERQIERLTKQNDALMAERDKVWAMLEEVSSAKHERELEMHREVRQDKTTEQLLGQAKAMMPLVLAKLGTKRGEAPVYAGKTLVDALLEKIFSNDERRDKYLAVAAEQHDEIALLMQLVEIRKAEHDAAKAKEEKTNGVQNGAPPAGGAS